MSGQKRYHQPGPIPTSSQGNKVAVRTTMTIVSSVTLGFALYSGAIIAIIFFVGKFFCMEIQVDKETIIYKIIPIGVTYLVCWIVSLISLRKMNNIVLPYLINIYAWLTMIAISFLYIAVICKLYEQKHDNVDFIRYTVMLAVLFIAFIGLHLLVTEHDLAPFSFLLLAINLAHLFIIDYHYIYSSQVDNRYIWSDFLFLFEMSFVSVLMFLRLGIFSGVRKFIDDLFE